MVISDHGGDSDYGYDDALESSLYCAVVTVGAAVVALTRVIPR